MFVLFAVLEVRAKEDLVIYFFSFPVLAKSYTLSGVNNGIR